MSWPEVVAILTVLWPDFQLATIQSIPMGLNQAPPTFFSLQKAVTSYTFHSEENTVTFRFMPT